MIASVIGTGSYTSILVCSPFYFNSTTTAVYIGICELALDDLEKGSENSYSSFQFLFLHSFCCLIYWDRFTVSTVGLKWETPHTVRFEITATPQDGILFTAIPQNISDTANPHAPLQQHSVVLQCVCSSRSLKHVDVSGHFPAFTTKN